VETYSFVLYHIRKSEENLNQALRDTRERPAAMNTIMETTTLDAPDVIEDISSDIPDSIPEVKAWNLALQPWR